MGLSNHRLSTYSIDRYPRKVLFSIQFEYLSSFICINGIYFFETDQMYLTFIHLTFQHSPPGRSKACFEIDIQPLQCSSFWMRAYVNPSERTLYDDMTGNVRQTSPKLFWIAYDAPPLQPPSRRSILVTSMCIRLMLVRIVINYYK